jgi:hypothetical protein
VCLTAYLMSVNVYGFTVLANRKMCCELYSRRSLRDSGYDDYDAGRFQEKTGISHINPNPPRITPKTHNQRVFVEFIYLSYIVVCGGPAGSG